MAAVTTFRDAEYVDTIGIDLFRQQRLSKEFFPGVLFGALIPAVVGTFVGYLWDEVDGGCIVKAAAYLQSGSPFLCFGA